VADLTDALLGHFVDQARRAGCSWSQIGEALGVSKQAAQQKHSARLPMERVTERTRVALEAGLEAAQRAGRREADTPDVLLGLLAVPDSLAGRLLAERGYTAELVSAALPDAPAGDAPSPGRLPGYSATAARVLSGAFEQALMLGHNYIGTEHVLLSLAAEPEGPVAAWFAERGDTRDRFRDRVEEVLSGLAGA
jgi:ATP-dependent Clp protease ATP-binding subunit ClpA